MQKPITFNLNIGKKKPYFSIKKHCPFCDTDNLTDIICKQKEIIWLMNKFPVLEKTWPTVIIETKKHDDEFTQYTYDKLHSVFSFLFNKWLEIESSGKFKSVICFRNYGSLAGGSQRHPHSQIIGLHDYDYKESISEKNFIGPTVFETQDCIVSMPDFPIYGIGEFNVTLKKDGNINKLAETIQKTACFLLNDFLIPCNSYNIFFYNLKNIHAKVIPIITTNPLHRGYYIKNILSRQNRNLIKEILLSEKYFGD